MIYLKNAIEYYAFLLIINILCRLPYKLVLFIVKKLFYVFGYTFGIRKKIVVKQLRLCFPEKNDEEITDLTKRIYTELAITVAEVFVFDDKYFEDKIEVINFEEVQKALQYNRGLIIISAHFSNWELGVKVAAKHHPPIYGIVKNQRNLLFNKYINDKREAAGIITIEMKNALKHVVAAMKQNHIVAIAVDQYAQKQGVEMDFMGHPTKTYTSAAQLAIKYKIPIIAGFDVRDEKGFHKVVFNEMMLFENIDYNNDNILEVTAQINRIVEDYIKKYPQLWFWVHKKWRK